MYIKFSLLLTFFFITLNVYCETEKLTALVTRDTKVMISRTSNEDISIIPHGEEVYVINFDPDTRWSFSSLVEIEYKDIKGWVVIRNLFFMLDTGYKEKVNEVLTIDSNVYIEDKFYSETVGINPEIEFFKDGTLSLLFNRCSSLNLIIAKYRIKDDIIYCYDFEYNRSETGLLMGYIYTNMFLRFKVLNPGELILIDKTSYNDGVNNYGFCAPKKDDIFIRTD